MPNRARTSKLDLKIVEVELFSKVLSLAVPTDIDAVIDQSMESGLDPYWGELWDAAVAMARMIRTHPALFFVDGRPPQRLQETGCGVGLVGIAARHTFGGTVDFSDLVPEAVDLAVDNARRNGFDCHGFVVDWHKHSQKCQTRYDGLLASDVLYDRRGHDPFLDYVPHVLRLGGRCWIGDPGRIHAASFVHLARDRGWEIEIRGPEGEPRSDIIPGEFHLLTCMPHGRSDIS